MICSRRDWLAALLGAGYGCNRQKKLGFVGHAFIANADGKAVAVVDLSALALVRHISLGANPTEVAVGGPRSAVYAIAPDTAQLHEIDGDRLELRRKVRLPGRPSALQLSPDGATAWAIVEENRHLVSVALDKMQLAARVGLPGHPASFAFSPEDQPGRGWIAVSLGGTGKLAMIRRDSAKIEQVVELGGDLGPVRFRHDGKYIVVGDRAARQVVIWDVAARQLVVRLPVPVRPDAFCVKADGGELFVAGEGMPAVVSVYPYQTEVGNITLAGKSPGFMAASATPAYLFVANPQSNDVTIIDINVNIKTQKVKAVAVVGREPCYIAITPDNSYALVLNRNSGDLAVLLVDAVASKRTSRRDMFVPMVTMIPVGSRPVSAVVRVV